MDQIQNTQTEQPISDGQKQELLGIVDQLQKQMSKIGATRFASKNESEIKRIEILKKVLQKLQMAGVDLSDQNSVSSFIMKLKQSNPEMAARFESSIATLLGGETDGGFSKPEDFSGKNNMNNTNETVPQNIQGSIPSTRG